METFRFLARFNHWVNERLYSVVAEVPEAEYKRQAGAFFGSIHQTLNHVLVIDRVQLSRFNTDGPGDATSAWHVMNDSFAGLRAMREPMDMRIIETVDSLEDSILHKTYSFTTLAAGRHLTMIGRHMLLAMFNHQTHH